jgi:iron complex transport system permease protein
MKKYGILLLLTIILLIIMIFSLSTGAHKIPFEKILSIFMNPVSTGKDLESDKVILFSIRFPRVLLAIVIGSALGYSGTLIQGLFRNLIADPGLVGVSSGASLFATIFIVLGSTLPILSSPYSISFTSFFGSVISLVLVYKLSTRQGKTNIATLLLAGIAIGSIARSIIGFLVYISNDAQLRNISFWNLGSLSGANTEILPIVFLVTLPGFFFYPFLYKALNALTLGEREAFHLGIPVESIKKKLIAIICLSVGGSISFTGMIEFIGLISPHIGRYIIGPNHKHLLPASALIGASLLTLADVLSRTIVSPSELPIGILTSALGAPFFLYLVIKKSKEFSL